MSPDRMTLRISPNRRYLLDSDGRPFFYLADTAWRLLYRLDRAETDHYLCDRAAKGFNAIQFVVFDIRYQPNRFGHAPYTDDDAARPNEEFFEHLDWVVGRCAELGMYAVLLPNWGYVVTARTPGGEHYLERPLVDQSNAYAQGLFLGRRYRDRPVIWMLGGDQPEHGKSEVFRLQATGIADGDDGAGLITYHPRGQASSSQWFHTAAWCDLNSLQSGHLLENPNWQMIEHDWSLDPPKPTLDSEPMYENMPQFLRDFRPRADAWHVRKQAYWAVFSGACGHTYGCNDVFMFWLPGGPEPTFGANLPWPIALQLPGSHQMGFLKELVEGIPEYASRVPDNDLIVRTDRAADAGHVCATSSADRNLVLCYTSHGHGFTLDVEALPADLLRARWFDPRAGEYQEPILLPGRAFHTFVPPKTGEGYDWVLRLEPA
ncbi:MAG: DUF4038 domain-containing protein [Chloroflexi bacterium]|nr:DUF4038 domain-containing protein [Chloroflexota bacterium]